MTVETTVLKTVVPQGTLDSNPTSSPHRYFRRGDSELFCNQRFPPNLTEPQNGSYIW